MILIISILVAVSCLALLFGGLLGFASVKLKTEGNPIVEKIDAILPQSQCGQCGYPGCKPYAQAVADGDDITKCVPGGKEVIIKIAEILGVEVPDMSEVKDNFPKVALIHEDMCIGCTKCVQACPVDAIIGTNRQLHTVIADLCTGCERCVSPCPTDCIEMIKIEQTLDNWNWKFDPNLRIPALSITENNAEK